MWQDIRLTIRSLFRSRTFALVCCATLALGTAATTTTFMLVHAVLLEAMPYPKPESLVTIGGRMERDGSIQQFPMSYLDIASIAADSDAFEAVAGVSNARSFNLRSNGDVEHLSGEMVGPEYARLLGVRMAQGRWFTEEENRPPDADRVVVLGHGLWQRRFGSQASILGSTVELNETSYTVIGVAEEGFLGLSDQAQLWLPLGTARAVYGVHYTDLRQFRWLFAIARLKGAGVAQTQKRVDALSTNLQREFATENTNLSFALTPITDAYLGQLRKPLLALFGAAFFVLLIAGTNVANLQLVRSLSRRRELSVRAALGAGTGRLARTALMESVSLVLIGTLIGLILAIVVMQILISNGSLQLQSFIKPRLNVPVVVVSIIIALVSAGLSGLIPTLFAARTSPADGLGDGGKGGTVGRGHLRLQRGLVVVEVALALTLLAGAGLMVKGFIRFIDADLGFRPQQLLSLRLDLTADRFRQNESVWNLVRSVASELQAIPGVTGVTAEGPGFPGSGWYQITLFKGADIEANRFPARRHHVTPGYFATLGIPIRAGRDLAATDMTGAPMAVLISERFAALAFPGGSAVGQRLRVSGGSTTELTVVGVVGNVQHSGLQSGDAPQSDVYLSLYQSPPRSPSLVTLFVATTQTPETIIRSISPVLKRVDAGVAFFDVQTMTQRLRSQTATGRLLVTIMVAFAMVGLLLAALGVYGIIAYAAERRTKEVGIRLALGADRAHIVRQVVRQALAPVLVGILAGAISVAAFTRFLESLLYGLSPFDPIVLIATGVVFILVALGASWLPARRAVRVNPVSALRAE